MIPMPALEPSRLPPGTHVMSRRRGYTHHGIYVGDGQVVHYAGRIRYAEGLVEEIPLEAFARGRLEISVRTPTRYEAEEIVRRARSRLGEHSYRLFSNNCEHFSTWCLRGESHSAQVDRWLALPRKLLRRVADLSRLPLGRPATLRSV